MQPFHDFAGLDANRTPPEMGQSDFLNYTLCIDYNTSDTGFLKK